MSILGGSVVGGLWVQSSPYLTTSSPKSEHAADKLGKLPYKGRWTAQGRQVARHGPARFYAGFLPYFPARVGPSLFLKDRFFFFG